MTARAAIVLAAALAAVTAAVPVAGVGVGVVWADDAPAATAVRRALDEGLKRFQDLEYRGAIEVLTPVRRDPAAGRAERLTALELIGISHLTLGEPGLAEQAFVELLRLERDHRLAFDDGSPKIREAFEAARRAAAATEAPEDAPRGDGDGEADGQGDDGEPAPAKPSKAAAAVEVEATAPDEATAGDAVAIGARVRSGLERVKGVVLRWRRRGDDDYAVARMKAVSRGRYRGRIVPPAADGPYAIDFYVEARGVAGRTVGQDGGPDEPLSLAVAAAAAGDGADGDRGTPWYRNGYVLGGGAIVVGAGVAAFFLLREGATPDGSLDPGRVVLTP